MDQSKEAPFDYERLVGVIRDELDRGLKPVTEGLVRVEEAVKQTYSREVMDEKLKQRDARLDQQEAEIKEVRQLVGSFWTNAAVRITAVSGFIALVIQIVKGFH